MKQYLERRLQEKENQLARQKDSFKIMVNNEIDISTFERNAFSDLTLMLKLKTEIEELKSFILHYDLHHSIEKGGEG